MEDEAATTALDAEAVEALRSLDDGEGELLTEILGLYRDDAPGLVSRAREAIDAGNAKNMRAAAHTLKGSSANVGAKRLSSLCAQLQELGDGGTVEGGSDLLDEIGKELDNINAEIETILQG